MIESPLKGSLGIVGFKKNYGDLSVRLFYLKQSKYLSYGKKFIS